MIIYDRISGGLPRIMLQIAGMLVGRGCQALVCAPMDNHLPWAKAAEALGVSIELTAETGCWCLPRVVEQGIARFSPDLLVSSHRGCDVRVARLSRKYGLPHVVCIHSNYLVTDRIAKVSFIGLRNLFWQRALRRTMVIITPSQYIANDLLGNFRLAAEKLAIIPNAVEMNRYAWAVPKVLRTDGSPIRLIAAGRLACEKKPFMLVDLVLALKQLKIVIKATWLGGGHLLNKVVAYADSMGVSDQVYFCGNVDEPESYYRESDMLVHFCTVEGFGIVLAEALAAGLPIVAFRAGAVSEVVADKATGILVEPDAVSAMADGVAQLVKSPKLYHEMSAAGIARARKLYSLKDMGEQYASLFRKVILG